MNNFIPVFDFSSLGCSFLFSTQESGTPEATLINSGFIYSILSCIDIPSSQELFPIILIPVTFLAK